MADGSPTQQEVLPTPTEADQATLAQTVVDISERGALLVREEIELAKTEVVGLLFVLHGLAWLAWWALPVNNSQIFWGFFVVAAVLFVLGGLAGFLAFRALKAGAPPMPSMAIDEAKRIRETVQSPEPRKTI